MSQTDPIARLLRAAQRTQRFHKAWHGAFHGLVWGSGACLLILALWKLFPLPYWTPVAAAGLALGGLLAGLMAGGWRRPGALETARWLDRRLGLQERLSTAWECRASDHPWRDLVWEDAVRHAAECPPERVKAACPWSVPPVGRWAMLCLAVAAALGWVPEYRSAVREQAAQEKANIAETGKRLASIIQHKMKEAPPALPPTQKALEAVAELGNQWQRSPPTRAEAVAEAARLAAQLQRQTSELEKNPGLKKLERLARESGLRESSDPAALQRQVAELQNKLGAAAGQGQKLEELQKQLEKAKAAAEKLANATGEEAEAARAQLSQALAALQQEAMQLGQNLEGLEAALKALAEAKPGQAVKNLELALQDLEKLRDLAEKLKNAQRALEQAAGKDLAEQLDKGQVGAALKTLETWRQQLQSGNPSPETLQKMMDELAKALGPAEDYGQLREKLERALKNLQQKQPAAASQCLGEAIKELEDLLHQLNDAECLAEALQTLLRAEEAIAQGQCLSQCRGGRSVTKKGAGSKGVGDWADENADPMDFGVDELWDNSSVLRPDKDARGHTDRPIGEPDQLDPTKIQGKLNPGQPMPSVTLKGVSIKGVSKVEMEEAAAAARAEAEHALNQDRVPRAYRQQVKEYFEDLK